MTKKIIRFLTSGSVDDGKSTLLGRLLYDTDSLYDDQIAEIKKLSGDAEIDYSLFIEGLESERKQKITIDVAYRYFTQGQTRYIIADAPGHEEYTRNMAVAASNSDLAVLVVSAKDGVKIQTLRHFYISYLFGIRHFIVAVNKMDLVGFVEDPFKKVKADFLAKIVGLKGVSLDFIPIVAKSGANIAGTSELMPWYKGKTLLASLNHAAANLNPKNDGAENQKRFLVQSVQKFEDKRLYHGLVTKGSFAKNEEIFIYPSATKARILELAHRGKDVDTISDSAAATIVLADDRDVERGSIFSSTVNKPNFAKSFTADLIWFAHDEFSFGKSEDYLLQLNGERVNANIHAINHLLEVHDFTEHSAKTIKQNQIANVTIHLAKELPFDSFDPHKFTGSFLLIGKHSHATIACGLIRKEVTEARDEKLPSHEFINELAALVKKHFGAEQANNFINQLK